MEKLERELGVEPAAETRALVEAIRADQLETSPVASLQPKRRLPKPATPLIGHEAELEEIVSLLLNDASRLLSIVAPGGMGKTRLALEVAHKVADRFADGAAFASLASLEAPVDIVPALGQALHVSLAAGDADDAKAKLLSYLQSKALLLIVDNFEHLLAGAPLLVEILATAPEVSLLVTSRERLRLQAERIYPLKGLTISRWETVEEARRDPAVRLFLQHGRRVRPALQLEADDLDPLRQILELVQGMPLAIILAASWLELLSPVQIAAEIGHALDFLEADYRDLPERQRSMRTVFASTWERLSQREQTFFAALSVFHGGFTLEAARQVADASLGNLATLSAKSLVQFDAEEDRYQIHELLRQFGQDKLQVAPTVEQDVRQRHAAFYCHYLHKRQQAWDGPGAGAALAEVRREKANVRLAWRWAVAQEAVPLLAKALRSLAEFYAMHGYDGEARELLRAASESLFSPVGQTDGGDIARRRLLVRLLTWQNYFAASLEEAYAVLGQAEALLHGLRRQKVDVRREEAFFALQKGRTEGSFELLSSRPYHRRSLSLYQELGDPVGEAQVTLAMSGAEWHLGNHQQAAELARRGLEGYRVLGNQDGVAQGLNLLGQSKKFWGRLAEAHQAHQESYGLYRELGNRSGAVRMVGNLANTLCWSGNFAGAWATAMEGLRLTEDVSLPWQSAWVRRVLGQVCLHLGRYDEAQQHLDRSVALSRETDARKYLGWALLDSGKLSLVTASPETALAQLEEAVSILTETGASTWTLPLIGEALALHRLGRLPQARKALAEALQANIKSRIFLVALNTLPAAAQCVAAQGDVERALELYAVACRYRYVTNSRWCEELMGESVTEWKKMLPSDVVEAARVRDRSRDLWETAEEPRGDFEDDTG